ncbi:hypothetical protein GP486_006397, partial [Trichoglossum hirsutum]
ILTLSTTPGTTQNVWINEYFNSLRTTAEVFASTPELSKLVHVALGYFAHDSQSKASTKISRDGDGKPLSWECTLLPVFARKVLDAHDVAFLGGSLRPAGIEDDETTTKE